MSNIVILLSTFNGEKYLQEQLDSLSRQSYKNFEIIVRDDGSSDATIEILKRYNVSIMSLSKNIGVKKSFEALLEYALKNSGAEYFMFCDQDDVWLEDKVEKTFLLMKQMEKQNNDIPLLVHTDLEVVDDKLRLINKSLMSFQRTNPLKNKFNNLLMQNTVTGCTVMINKKLALESLPFPSKSVLHDWWLALVASEYGKIAFLNNATIQYRQHTKNDIGAKKFGLSFIFHMILKKINIDKNINQAEAFLEKFEAKLDYDTKTMLAELKNFERKTFWEKRLTLLRYKLFKQGKIKNIGLFFKI